ncbi:hypothetical protein [Pseudomonas sp. NFACC05-1]|uniref:hypothetical protein n=1 Tax=Pseudomonas sp. NFACC05-1 TaxID=1566241 RepID=UPI0011135A8B|nr:hypothetical protein [Pseudomonas sp. NFACC05-1]
MSPTNGFDFLEPLPDSCPPENVNTPTEPVLWRLLRASVHTAEDFDSQRKRLSNHKYPDECLARSVSLMTSLAACRAAVKSPLMAKMKFTHAVEIPCDPKLGVWHKDQPNHVNWWPYLTVNPTGIAGRVEDLNG